MDKRERKRYTREFKREAVRLAEASELPATQVARQLGIHRNMLASWRKELAELGDQAFGNDETEDADQARVEELQREVARLRQERDILKKALAIINREKEAGSR